MAVDPNALAADIVDQIEADTGNTQVAAAQIVWLAFAKAASPYFVTGGTGVAQVTAGSSKVSVSPTTGNVVVDVVPGNFTGIPQSAVTGLVSDLSAFAASLAGKANTVHSHAQGDVTGLVADLAAKVPTTRTVSTSAPLTGGGTLSSDLTLGIDLAGLIAASSNFGDGFNGAAVFDGDNPVANFTLASGVYSATSTPCFTNVTLSTGVTIQLRGVPLNVTGKLTVVGSGTATIECNGPSATGQSGATFSGIGFLPVGRGGGNGGANAGGGNGGNALSPTSWSGRCTTATGSNGGAVNTVGGGGGVPFRGGGGGGGATTNTGGTSGTTTMPAASGGAPRLEMFQVGGQGNFTITHLTNGSGGGGGGGGTAGIGGGGGAGGGYLLCNIREIEVPGGATLALEANGGNGAAGTGTGGGGGGGGGGHCVLFYTNKTGTVTQTANGGAGGAGGTGAAGGAGFAGQTYQNPTF